MIFGCGISCRQTRNRSFVDDRKSRRYFRSMSSVGFTSNGKDIELDKLREAYDSLKDVVRGIEAALACIDAMNFGMAKAHLNAAKWQHSAS